MNSPKPDGPHARKKKQKKGHKLLSFDGDEDEESDRIMNPQLSAVKSSKRTTDPPLLQKKANPNSALPAPKAMTKAAQALETVERERLKKEFLETQEKVKSTDIAVPFVFYDGANIPGGMVKVKKGDHIWLMLERARKIGAEQGVQGSSSISTGANPKNRDDSRKQWARVGVDDLMLVRGEVIIPHHYEIYYFIANKSADPNREGHLLFNYSSVALTSAEAEETTLLRVPGKENLEGHDDDPAYTKVVDRRWYEKNKHIFPASTWKEFRAGKEFEEQLKGGKDAEGNTFFYS